MTIEENNHPEQFPSGEDETIEEGVVINGETTANHEPKEPDQIIGGAIPPDHTLRNILIALAVLLVLLCCCCTLLLVALSASGFFETLANEFAQLVSQGGQYLI